MPPRDATELVILAFLESPSVAGAYRFRLTPGNNLTRMHVEAELYFRETPKKVGIAPLTSMWMWGDGLKGPPKDQRPSVHDSDGLLIHRGADDWTWRAFARQSYPSVTDHPVDRLVGFGFIQRNRAFFHYDDHNARYDLRPSVWIQPDASWQNGKLQLLELPGAHEGVDNLAAYWIPSETPSPGQPLRLAYEVSFFAGDPTAHNVMARATNLSIDRPLTGRSPIGVEIRFSGSSIRGLPHPRHLRPGPMQSEGKLRTSL